MGSLKALTKRPAVVAPALFAAVGLVVVLAWPSVRLWRAKRKAMAGYADAQDRAALNIVPAGAVRRLAPADPAGERASAELEAYRYSLPAATYTVQPQESTYVDFDSPALTVRVLGADPLTSVFSTLPITGSKVTAYFATTDPYRIIVDAYNARPDDIATQRSLDALNRHLLLLLLKAILAPTGIETHWEHFDTGRYRGDLAGDTSLKAIVVMLYLPSTKDFASIAIFPKDGATMADVYEALAGLIVEPVEARR